jgi:hypothetical protein
MGSTSRRTTLIGVGSEQTLALRTDRISYCPSRHNERSVDSEVPFNDDCSHILFLRGEQWDGPDADALVLKTLCSWYNHSIPIYVVLVGGGPSTLKLVVEAVAQSIPIFVVGFPSISSNVFPLDSVFLLKK